jgi:hypothetical protein
MTHDNTSHAWSERSAAVSCSRPSAA